MTTCGLCEKDMPGTSAYLCRTCETGTVGRLVALPGQYENLAERLAPGSRSPGPTPTAPRPGASLPLNTAVLDLSAHVLAVVESWRAALHDDAGWGPPPTRGTSSADRLRRACRGLRLNMPWIVANWPPAGAMAEEIRDLARDVESVLDPVPAAERGVRLGLCPAADASGVLCGAVLRHYPGRPVVCEWCGCQYGPETWLNLKTWMDHDEEEAS